jgi:cytosine/adenosine deaminase-related metal-dependent hydrolase
MRTLIRGSWVVGFNGQSHVLIPNGVVVYEDDTILHVGHQFDGQVDKRIDATGCLISPGLINCHLHFGSNARHIFLLDHTRADFFGSNFMAYSVGKRGVADPADQQEAGKDQLFGLWAAIRGGATTVMDVGTRNPEGVAKMAGDLGARVYIGPRFRTWTYGWDERGQMTWDPDPHSGEAGLHRAVEFATTHDGTHEGRVRCLLVPAQLDTCSPDLLKAARRAANETGLKITLHTAMNLLEFHRILREYGKTPIELLDSIGFLGPDVLLGHCVFHNNHSWVHYPYTDDLQRLADSGASVAHAPFKYLKMGITLESFTRYRQKGINIALGTDTYPEDLVREMRYAALMCRVADGSFRVGTPQEVFDAATLGGARALGRDDLGRLAPGARADLLVFDLQKMHFGAVHDPIKALVDGGDASDIRTLVVNGKTLIDDHQALVVDEARLLSEAQAAGEKMWAATPEWHWNGASADDLAPMSYPVVEDGRKNAASAAAVASGASSGR